MLTRRDVALLGLAAVTSISTVSSVAKGAGQSDLINPRDDLLNYVDPELRSFLRTIPAETTITEKEVKRWRRNTEPSSAVTDGVVARSIPGPRGAPDIRIFIAGEPARDRNRPALLYMHGGGYISGSTASSWPGFSGLQQIAKDHDCIVVSVDYRLAPETRFPGPLEDNYAALKWLHSNATELGVNPMRIAVMGESAGGGHAAMLAIAARDRGEVPILFQLLIYPMLDDRTGSAREVPRHMGAFIWTPQSNRFGWSSLLGIPAGSETIPEGSVPARVRDLRGLPATYIGVGSLDLFVDEDIEFSRRLIRVGVPTELYVAPGAYHGFFFLVPHAAVSRKFYQSYNAALTRAFSAQN